MTLATVLIYVLLVLGIALVVLGVLVVTRQLLAQTAERGSPAGAPAPYLSALVIIVGIASLGTSAFLSLRKPAGPEAVRAQSGAPGAGTPAVTRPAASTPAAPTEPPRAVSSSVPTGVVAWSGPAPGPDVQACDVFTGTSSLPADDTIVIGARNLDDPGNTTYLAAVSNYDVPSSVAKWTGILYFGSGNSSVGQTYVVSVIVMAASAVKSAKAIPANQKLWAVTSLPVGATIKLTLHLTRVTGQGPAACQ